MAWSGYNILRRMGKILPLLHREKEELGRRLLSTRRTEHFADTDGGL
jgi:hypothetical protein